MKEQTENKMKLKLLTAITFTFITAAAYADTFTGQIDLGPTGVHKGGAYNYPVNPLAVQFPTPLDGVNFNGQTITINLTFANDEFIRLYTADANNASNIMGVSVFFPNIPQSFQVLPGTMTLAGGIGSLPMSMYISGNLLMQSTLPVNQVGSLPVDITGISLDLTLPVSTGGFTDMGQALFEFGVLGGPDVHVFGVGPGIPADIPVPDSGSALGLISGAVLLLVGIKRYANSLS